jgi:dolichol-phosphate mannosyltransferase
MLHRFDSDLQDGFGGHDERPELAVIVPTYNERENIPLLIRRLRTSLKGLNWEVVFVDDDSPDGTSEAVVEIARRDRRVRLVHRVGRRGLSSACIEGMLATASPYIAVLDADLQHDESILPAMLQKLKTEELDVVVATRNAEGGSMGAFSASRVFLSRLGQKLSQSVSRCTVSDPMSGFFLLRRTFLHQVIHRLNGNGFKILLDILASSSRPVLTGEVGYRFGKRQHGKSKLDAMVAFEYIAMLVEKLTGGTIPTRVFAFSAIGAIGVLIHFACLSILYHEQRVSFGTAQAIATAVAMVSNFFLNDLITFRDRRLKGLQKAMGLVTFCLGCTFGATANVALAETLLSDGLPWYIAAFAGIVVSSGWNYSISSLFTWHRPQPKTMPTAPAYPESLPQS